MAGIAAATAKIFQVNGTNLICEPCREQDHERCPGSTWCYCQHRRPGPVEPVTGPPGE